MRCWCKSRLASSCPTASFTVTKFSCVINSDTFWLGLEAKRTSRLVKMPTSLPPFSVTGTPEILFSVIKSSASDSLASGAMVSGLTTMPLSNFFTLVTSAACSCGVRLRCNTPMPPACAMAIAISLSVTVSMAADKSGIPKSMDFVMRVAVSASLGKIVELAGSSKTSSKVRASRNICQIL